MGPYLIYRNALQVAKKKRRKEQTSVILPYFLFCTRAMTV